ncbi:putative Strictosidine synthase family protein [Quillaja saponaria]|uniref:Strictosidine synthase family protein n=1 Tax=Quillaja saponaria TaxID=32244 RepID=A0AAD7LE87_QUISA|nr:putative Strictosidine synthase family protein [Quillaja saponaria]
MWNKELELFILQKLAIPSKISSLCFKAETIQEAYSDMIQGTKKPVLLRGLSVAAGVAISRDGAFVLVSEFMANRIQRVWVRGPRANTSEIFLPPVAKPDNIKRNSRGEFWVAVNNLLGPPQQPKPPMLPLRLRVNEQGIVLQPVLWCEWPNVRSPCELSMC